MVAADDKSVTGPGESAIHPAIVGGRLEARTVPQEPHGTNLCYSRRVTL